MNLVASLIVKNERNRLLPEVIGHLRDFCDLIAIVDDGSTDGTAEWCRDNTDSRMVVKYLDADDGFFAGHEGRRRQALLAFTLEQKPTWVLSIDADEFISDGDKLRRFCDTPKPVGSLMMEEVWKAEPGKLQIRIDGGWRPHPVPVLWRAPVSTAGRFWQMQDRALACGREPVAVRRLAPRARGTGVSIFHFGWAKESARKARHQRYVTADGGKYHQSQHLASILYPPADVTLSEQKWPPSLLKYRDLIVEHTT